MSVLKNSAMRMFMVTRVKNLRGRGWTRKSVIFLILSGMVAALAYVLFADRVNIYTVSARTDVMNIVTADSAINQWRIPADATVFSGLNNDALMDPSQNPAGELDVFNHQAKENFIIVNPGVQVTFFVNHANNEFVMTLQHPDFANGSVGYLDQDIVGRQQLDSYVDVIIGQSRQLLFPFMGEVVIGDDVSTSVAATLLSGNIRIIEQELFGDVRYVSGEFELDQGDRVTLHNDIERNTNAVLRGFVRYEPDDSMYITTHGETTVARVERLGSAGYDAKTSLWKRFGNDPVVMALTSLYAIIFLMLEFTVMLRSLFAPKKEQIKAEEVVVNR
ncbi:hypothetical protein ACQ661_09525 [Pseudidiomarina sp. WS423]|uniref:hypothetical protein n=1 Tax=Pseudidiomarina sp. WS423 TaxID=3425124 RepID=UPI003D6FA3EC